MSAKFDKAVVEDFEHSLAYSKAKVYPLLRQGDIFPDLRFYNEESLEITQKLANHVWALASEEAILEVLRFEREFELAIQKYGNRAELKQLNLSFNALHKRAAELALQLFREGRVEIKRKE